MMRGAATPSPVAPRPARHYLTLLFSDLSDSTGLAAAMEPEIFSALLERLRERTAEIVARHGGEIIRIDGDRKSTRLTPVTNAHLVCRLLLEKKNRSTNQKMQTITLSLQELQLHRH